MAPDTVAGGLKLDSGSIQVISKDLFEKKDENDLLASLGPLASRSGAAAAELKTVDLTELDGFAVEAEEAEPEVATLLAQAARLYAQGQLTAAVEVLDRALEIDPESLDALWLKAGCLVRLGGREVEALRVLVQLSADASPGRRALRAQLYEALRGSLVPKTMLTAMLMLASGEIAKVIALSGEFARLDPGCGAYHTLLVSALGMEDRHDEALAAVDHGLEVADEDGREQLQELRATILRRIANEKMSDARELFLQGEYPKARGALERLEATLGEMPLYRGFAGYLERFAGYLERFDGGGVQPAATDRLPAAWAPMPPGTPKEADSVYFFLVGDLIAEGKQLYDADDFGAAARVLERALTHCVAFPYGNFLLGVALYSGIGKAIQDGRPPDGETALRTMQRVHAVLQIGRTDPDVGALAARLDASVEELLSSVEENKQDAELINPVGAAFEQALKRVGDGIESERHLTEVLAAMRQVKEQAAEIRGQVRTDEGKKALDVLTKRADEVIAQLVKLQGKAAGSDELKSLVQQFNSAVENLTRNPISSRDELAGAKVTFGWLHERADELVRKSKGAASKQAKELLKAIKGIEKQLNKA